MIPARVTATGPGWALGLNDVDDDDTVVTAPALLTVVRLGSSKSDESGVRRAAPTCAAIASARTRGRAAARSATPANAGTRSEPGAARPEQEHQRPVRHVDVRWSGTGWLHATAPAQDRRTHLRNRGTHARSRSTAQSLLAATDEREQLRYLLGHAERNANRAENDLKAARSRLRKSGAVRSAQASSPAPQFAGPRARFRYTVLTQWATRTLPAEQQQRPLGDYVLGPRFLDSLEKLEGIKAEKVADVVFEIATGLAQQLPSREVHHLRTGTGGDDPVRTRDDGAIAWRASLQVNTPSARRIHYWVLPSGLIELARVATHDDFDI